MEVTEGGAEGVDAAAGVALVGGVVAREERVGETRSETHARMRESRSTTWRVVRGSETTWRAPPCAEHVRWGGGRARGGVRGEPEGREGGEGSEGQSGSATRLAGMRVFREKRGVRTVIGGTETRAGTLVERATARRRASSDAGIARVVRGARGGD